MPDDLKEFWFRRYKETGHTGWKDPTVYAYDQIQRLAIVSAKIDALTIRPLIAIDFGCGTGDFSRLALEKGFIVWAYDPYVLPKISHRNFRYVSQCHELDIPNGKVGLILSVTVLDHILNDDELASTLVFLRKRISEQGFLLMMEYALDNAQRVSNKYQALRTIDQWENYLSIAGWNILVVEPVPHPVMAPSLGLLHFKKSIPVRLAGKIPKYRILTPYLIALLTKCARHNLKKHKMFKVKESPLKLITCTPTQENI